MEHYPGIGGAGGMYRLPLGKVREGESTRIEVNKWDREGDPYFFEIWGQDGYTNFSASEETIDELILALVALKEGVVPNA